jgi:hypothetical protein
MCVRVSVCRLPGRSRLACFGGTAETAVSTSDSIYMSI